MVGEQIKFGLFEPDKALFADLKMKLLAVGAVPLGSTSKDNSLTLINQSKLPYLNGAFVGDFGGSAKDMREIIAVLRDRFPGACLVGMVDSPKFKVGADYRTLYENLYSKFDWLIAQMISRTS